MSPDECSPVLILTWTPGHAWLRMDHSFVPCRSGLDLTFSPASTPQHGTSNGVWQSDLPNETTRNPLRFSSTKSFLSTRNNGMAQKSQEHFRFYDSEIRPTTAKVERHKGDHADQIRGIQISERTREHANFEDPGEGNGGAVRPASNI